MKPGCGDACGDACGSGMACHVATSQRAPRPTIFGRGGGLGVCDKLGWTQAGCGDSCGCADGCSDGCGLFQNGGCGSGCGACGGSGCNNCLQNGLSALLDCDGCGASGDGAYNFTPGPPVGQVAYPYYTTRGPRDFLMCNPPSIGPR